MLSRHNALAAQAAALTYEPLRNLNVCQIKIRAPWFNVQSWEASGKDADSRAIQLAGYLRNKVHAPTDQSLRHAADDQVLTLPVGFKGSVNFFDSNKSFVCRITFDKLGQDGFAVRSQQVDARVIGPHEIVIDKKITSVQCYVSVPKSLQASRLIIRDKDGTNQTRELTSPLGISLPLQAGFEGTLELVDAKKQLILRAIVRSPGVAGTAVQAQTIAGHCVAVTSRGGVLDLAVRPGSVRSRIY